MGFAFQASEKLKLAVFSHRGGKTRTRKNDLRVRMGELLDHQLEAFDVASMYIYLQQSYGRKS